MGVTKEKESQSFPLSGVRVPRDTTPAHFLFLSRVGFLFLKITSLNVTMKLTLSSRLHYAYTVLCAVLRERLGKGVSVVCAWLLPEAFVQRSNIAHNNWLCVLYPINYGYRMTSKATAPAPAASPLKNLFLPLRLSSFLICFISSSFWALRLSTLSCHAATSFS